MSLFEDVDTSEVQRAWDARCSELERLSTPRSNLDASFRRAREQGCDADASQADVRHLAQLDLSDGAWVDQELRTTLDKLDAAMADVRTLGDAVKAGMADVDANRETYVQSYRTLVAAKAKAKADMWRNIKWGVGFAIVVALFRMCAS